MQSVAGPRACRKRRTANSGFVSRLGMADMMRLRVSHVIIAVDLAHHKGVYCVTQMLTILTRRGRCDHPDNVRRIKFAITDIPLQSRNRQVAGLSPNPQRRHA